MICIYEDEVLDRLSPLVDLRPVFDLRCGRFTLLEKVRRLYPGEKVFLWVRDELRDLCAETHPDCRVNVPVKQGRLFLSARAILDEPVLPNGRESVLMAGDEVVGFRLCAECAVNLSSLAGLRATLAEEQVKARVVRYPWDLVEFNHRELERECRPGRQVRGQRAKGKGQNAGTVVGNQSLLYVAPGVRIWPNVVISTEIGPVFLDRDTVIRPGSFVEGPCYVGPGTVIDGAMVRPGCSFGPMCRIGGEVEASVFQGFSNKHHDGFIGHSFIGEWVNLGALTTNSDLKNAYEPVRVFFDSKPVDTGLLKVGCFIGDHVKTAIGTLLNSGTRVGSFANWFEPGLSPREIPAFAWGVKARGRLDQVLGIARTVMARRGIELSPAYEGVLRGMYRASSRQRKQGE